MGVGQAARTLSDCPGGQGRGIDPDAEFGKKGCRTALCGRVKLLGVGWGDAGSWSGTVADARGPGSGRTARTRLGGRTLAAWAGSEVGRKARPSGRDPRLSRLCGPQGPRRRGRPRCGKWDPDVNPRLVLTSTLGGAGAHWVWAGLSRGRVSQLREAARAP